MKRRPLKMARLVSTTVLRGTCSTRKLKKPKGIWYRLDFPNEANNRIGQITGQLWNFKNSIDIGDLIVMPRKGQPTIAIGEMREDMFFLLTDLNIFICAKSLGLTGRLPEIRSI